MNECGWSFYEKHRYSWGEQTNTSNLLLRKLIDSLLMRWVCLVDDHVAGYYRLVNHWYGLADDECTCPASLHHRLAQRSVRIWPGRKWTGDNRFATRDRSYFLWWFDLVRERSLIGLMRTIQCQTFLRQTRNQSVRSKSDEGVEVYRSSSVAMWSSSFCTRLSMVSFCSDDNENWLLCARWRSPSRVDWERRSMSRK